jgi:hypothetical protein
MRFQHIISALFVLLLLSQEVKALSIDKAGQPQTNTKNCQAFWIQNLGQIEDQSVFFRYRNQQQQVDVSEKGIRFYEIASLMDKKNDSLKTIIHRFDLIIEGASLKIQDIDKSNIQNFELRQWVNKVEYRQYPSQNICFKNVYPGIDLELECSDSTIAYHFKLHPGASASKIKLAWTGCKGFEIDDNGGMKLRNTINKYQVSTAKFIQKGVSSKSEYFKINDSTFSFNFPKYDLNQEAILDPVINWSTTFNGTTTDNLSAIDHDKNDNIFITGYTTSLNFPLINAGTYYVLSPNYGGDIFISKFDKNNTLKWSTFIIGNQQNYTQSAGAAIKCTSNGDIIIGGYTNSYNLPLQNSPGAYFQPLLNGVASAPTNPTSYQSFDGILMRFSNLGTLIYSTYIGGLNDDYIKDIALSSNNEIAIIGSTNSTNFPLPTNGSGFNQSINNGGYDGFIWTVNNNNNNVTYSSYLGGNNADYLVACAYDFNSNLYIAGKSYSDSSLPLINNGTFFQNTIQGASDAYLLKLNSSKNIVKSTLLGGAELNNTNYSQENIYDIAVNQNNEVFTLLATNASNYPVLNFSTTSFYNNSLHQATAPFNLNQDNTDYALSEFDMSGNLIYSTFLGGTQEDEFGILSNFNNNNIPLFNNDYIKIDDCNNKYIGLQTRSKDFPLSLIHI